MGTSNPGTDIFGAQCSEKVAWATDMSLMKCYLILFKFFTWVLSA